MKVLLRNDLQFNDDINPYQFVSKDTIKEIKKQDPNPLVKLYAVAHEGESRPKLIGQGTKVINWLRSTVNSITDKINIGIQCIKGHTLDNKHRGEKVLGSVIGKGLKEINNKLHSIIAVHFPDKNDSNYDVISMEADIEFIDDGNTYTAENVQRVMRFALGNSSEVMPAFSGAKELLSMQFYHEIETQIPGGNPMAGEPVMNQNRMTYYDVQRAVKELNIFPTQLYSINELIGSPKEEKGKIIFEGGIDNKVNEFLNSKLPVYTDKVEQLNQYELKLREYEEIEKEYNQIKKTTELNKLKSSVDSLIKDRNLDEKQMAWVKKRIEKFDTDKPTPEELNSFIEKELEDYKEFYQIHFKQEAEAETSLPAESKKDDYSEEMY